MSEQAKHSPLPWKVFAESGPFIGIGQQEGEGIADPGMWNDPAEARANAEFIVRAVNAHDKLTAALLNSAARFDDMAKILDDDGITGHGSFLRQSANRCRAALAKASDAGAKQ